MKIRRKKIHLPLKGNNGILRTKNIFNIEFLTKFSEIKCIAVLSYVCVETCSKILGVSVSTKAVDFVVGWNFIGKEEETSSKRRKRWKKRKKHVYWEEEKISRQSHSQGSIKLGTGDTGRTKWE